MAVVQSIYLTDNRRQHHTGMNPVPQRIKDSTSTESTDLRRAGLKVTLPRLKILDILAAGNTRHMSAEDIYKQLLESNEDIGLATVYRVLTQFEAAGLVTRHHFEGGMAVSIMGHITIISCVWTAAASKSSWMAALKSVSRRWRSDWGLRSATTP
jgi:DNA-binding transcriptional ArsR family regulator